MSEPTLTLPLLKWCVWDADQAQQPLPPLDFIEPMMRRRLSRLAKASLWVAHECVREMPDIRMIYASQHGEISRTMEMLNDLAENSPLSPTAFSMSVLNASVGLYSIGQNNRAPATAISAGVNTFAAGMLEAYGQLSRDPQAPVLLIYADEPLPEVVLREPQTQAGPFALALLFAADGAHKISMRAQVGGEPAALPQAKIFAQGLSNKQEAQWQSPDAGWSWRFE